MQKYNLNTLFNRAYNAFTKVKIVNIITKQLLIKSGF